MFIQNDRLDMRPSTVRWLNYRKIKRDFVKTLGPGPRGALRYRPYNRIKPLLEDELYMKRYFPDLLILEGSLEKAFLECRMVVLDHPGTTLHLVMAADVPTVCYWNPGDWLLCSQANEQFDRLREVNILFDNPEEASAHVNKIWDNVQEWWWCKNVREARDEWLFHHARTSRYWWWQWAHGIWKLATGKEIN